MAKHNILELDSIPRERKALIAVISQARYARRRSRAMLAAAAVCVLLGACVLGWTFAPRSPASSSPARPTAIAAPARQ